MIPQPEDARIEHYVILPKPDELPRKLWRTSGASFPRPKNITDFEYREFLTELAEHEQEKFESSELRRHRERLERVQNGLEEAISRFDGKAKKVMLKHLDNPAHLLRLAKERPEFQGFEEALKPDLRALLHDRPIINTRLCSETGVRHRKDLYYTLMDKGFRFLGNGEVPIGGTVRSGTYRVDQLYADIAGNGALFVEVSASMPTASEFSRKLRLVAESAKTGHKLLQKGFTGLPHLSRAWGRGEHSIAFYWGDSDLAPALRKILKNNRLAAAVREYPHDVLLLSREPGTGDVQARSVKHWLQGLWHATTAPEPQIADWRNHMPRVF